MIPLSILRLSFLSRFAVLALLTVAATAEARQIKPVTGRTLDRIAIRQTLPVTNFGDDVYAEVNSEWLKTFYRDYRSHLSKMGVVKWDARYDCRRFAGLFTELAQNQFYTRAFHSGLPAGTLALGPVWYRPTNSQTGHAIVVALTERGAVYLDPQNGRELQLTPGERASIFFAVL